MKPGANALQHRTIGSALSALLLAGFVLLLLSVSARAAEPNPSLGNFGSAAEPTFTKAAGVTVDQSNGDVIVVDGSTHSLFRYKPNGEPDPFSAVGTNVIDGKGGADKVTTGPESILGSASASSAVNEAQVAIAPPGSVGSTAGDIYATDSPHSRIVVFDSTGTYKGLLTASTEGGFGESCGVAVDVGGNVYTADYTNQKIHKFTPATNPPTNGNNVANYSGGHPCQLAAGAGSTSGYLFVATLEAPNPVAKLDVEGAEEGTTQYTIVGAANNIDVSVDPGSGHVYITQGKKVFEYDASGASSATLIEPSIELATNALGVGVDEGTGRIYVTRNSYANAEVFGPRPSGSPDWPLTIEVEGEGEVNAIEPPNPTSSEISACTELTGECSAEYTEGTKAPVTASAFSGWHFVEWEEIEGNAGDCNGASASCETGELEEATKLKAIFAEDAPTPDWPLTIEVEGEGEGDATEPPNPASGEISGCQESSGECSAEYLEGTKVPVTASAFSGWHFVEWEEIEGNAGDCNGASASCETGELEEATKLKAIFAENGSNAPLTLVKGGVEAGGTVTSEPAGINCGPGCDAETALFPEGSPVELEAEAADGYVFAGWLNCKYKSPGVCEVTVDGATEVTAVFFKEGEEGETPTITTLLPGEDAHCPEGGTKITLGATEAYACNGEEGEAGDDGENGEPGEPGTDGTQGPPGQNGFDGAQGPQGAVGPQGPQGQRGPAGKVTVSCKVRQKGKKVKVTCTVKQQSNNKRHHLRWRLMAGGHAQSHGKSSVTHLNRLLSHLRPGSYVLHVNGQKAKIVVPAAKGHNDHRHAG